MSNKPSFFSDPVAELTEWTPLVYGGAGFRTQKLIKIGENRIEFRSTAGALILFLCSALTGIVIIVNYSFFGCCYAVVGGNLFLFAGIYGFYYSITTPVVVDKQKGFFWKGRKKPDEPDELRCVNIDKIHAIQIIAEWVEQIDVHSHVAHGTTDNDREFLSYELNIVLHSGRRINVMDHGAKEKIMQDADELAKFIDKPIWDATDMKFEIRKTRLRYRYI